MASIEDLFTPEQNFQRNQAFLRPGTHNYNTKLSPEEETQFRVWLMRNNVPFNPFSSVTDYDMRGFWKALQAGNPAAKSAIDPNDNKIHYPDYWKTPYDATFSAQSQWADPAKAPNWQGDKLVLPSGTVLYDDQAQKWLGPMPPGVPSAAVIDAQKPAKGSPARGAP